MGCMSSNEKSPHLMSKTQINPQKNQQQFARLGIKNSFTASPDGLKNPSLQQLINRQQRQYQSINPAYNMQVRQVLLGTKDRRQVMDEKIQHPFNCIGLLYFSNIYSEDGSIIKEYVATGFLVAPNIVMTAAHFIELFKKIGKQIKFVTQTYKDEEFYYSCLHAKKMVHYSLHNNYDSFNKQIWQDYALVYLEESIPRNQYIRLAANFRQIDAQAHIYGYPIDFIKSQFNLIGMKGLIKSIENNIVQYDVDTSVGQSGSPILVEYIDDQYIAIGIHSGKDDKDKYNCGCLITQQTIKTINQWANQFKRSEKINEKFKIETERQLSLQNGHLEIYSQHFLCLSLEKSNINIVDQLKRFQTNKKQASGSILSPLQSSSQAFAQEKHHLSIAYAQKGLQASNILQRQRFQLLSLIGKNYQKLLQFNLALFYYSQCLNCEVNLDKTNNIIIIKTLNCIGNAFLELNQIEKAKKFFRKAKKLRKGIKQQEYEKIEPLINEGTISLADGNVLKAYNLFKSAKLISFKTDQHSQQKASIVNNLAITSFNLKKYDEWLQYSFASLWILRQMNLTRQPQYLNWSVFFIKQVNSCIQRAQQSQKLKFGRVCKILGLGQEGFDPIIIEELKSLFPRNKKLKVIQ